MQTALTFVLWILFGWITAYFAVKRGRDPIIWFFIGMFMGALGLLFLFILPKSMPEEEIQKPVDVGGVDDAITIKVEPITTENSNLAKEWYYINDERLQIGPVDFQVLKNAWDSGVLKESSFVWSDGMDDWKQISEIEEIKNRLLN